MATKNFYHILDLRDNTLIKAAVVPNTKKDNGLILTKKLVNTLNDFGASVFLSSEFSDSEINAEFLCEDKLFSEADFVVTVGGDGTILGIAEYLSDKSIPVIGVNLGRVGFMAELEPDEIYMIENVIKGNYTVEKRMMLDVTLERNGTALCTYRALNDIVVSKGSISKIAELELYCNSTPLTVFNADGVIVSTPTGSTAYSLSAGGAIIDPTIDCMILTPVCPHSLFNVRPIIFSSKSELEIKNIKNGEENTYLTVDGRINVQLMYSDVIKVAASDKTIDLIKIKEEDFYKKVYHKIAERR